MLCLLICKRWEKKKRKKEEKKRKENFKPQLYKNIKVKEVVNEERVI